MTAVERKTNAEYARQSDAAVELMIDYVKDENGWNLVKTAKQNNGVKVERRRAPANDMDIFMATMDLEHVSVDKVLAMVLPWLPYRVQWDDLLESANIIEQLSPTRYIIQHLTKSMMPLSSRESIDVVQVCKRDGTIYVAATDTEHPRTPLGANGNKYVRTVQHLGGYAISPINDHGCRFMMIFHADLNLPAAKLISGIVDWVKPKLMTDKLLCLQKAMTKISINQDIIDSIAITDSVAVADPATVTKPVAVTKSAAEPATVTKPVAEPVAVNKSVAVADPVAVTKSAAEPVAVTKSIADPVTVTDSGDASDSADVSD